MTLASGTRLGPYEIVERLGAGGMGEVYRARDPRLSREVAVKLISTDGATSPDRPRRFETEARAAAQLSHPNVITVFDVGTHLGQPYLVLELLDGETLRETLHGGTPPLRQAVSWALDISRGLAAAHERGIVHRDLKPENVFLTKDGRVKVLDFGLAKLHEPLVSDEADRESPTATKDTAPGVLLGTVGYMSPEQVKGRTPDSRTDVFALGAVLYEMVSGRRAFGGESAPEVLAAILRDEPPALESLQHGVPAAVETVVRRCLAKRPADRFSSARAVEAALETALSTLEPSRVSVNRAAESRGPYPGLSAYTEADAERFFGRETEVEALWEKLRRGRLLAVIGPSGAGKTSFVRAGLVPAHPTGWGAMVATPGGAPMRALAQALVEELPSDSGTMKQLLGFDDPDVAFAMVKKWRETHLEAVLVLDQFEELFTLCPPEVQERFAGLLGRLVREADVHVLLSLRDDFLMRCHEQEPLSEVFEHLTPLGPLSEEGARQALVEPAEREGFSFEDNALVAEMLESVEGARGALPLLAFAVARLWEKRDRERKLLTRRAYEEIGGVAGALAQHAEQTLERIGSQREPVVGELFRNLVTAQWTRAVAERDQLLSVLPDAEAGAQVLDSLVDARLLTSYEARETPPSSRGAPSESGDEGSSASPGTTQRIEIVHESLLRAWPRLVRWQAQDEEGAVLRDQLKQAAHLWEEKGRPDDLLWTGTSEREFELWHDRYPGRLTALEEQYSKAMVDRTRRRKRLRRAAAVTLVVCLAAVAAVTGTLWKRAQAEARRAEAGKLLALGRNQLEADPTAALAYARGSLDLYDAPEARRFVLETLWRGPVARLLPLDRLQQQAGLPEDPGFIAGPVLSPDGRWLAMGWQDSRQIGQILLLDRGGSPPRALPRQPDGTVSVLAFGPRNELLITGGSGQTLRLWSLPDLREIRTVPLGGVRTWRGQVRDDTLFLVTTTSSEGGQPGVIQALTLPDGELRTVGINRPHENVMKIGSAGALLYFSRGGSFGFRPIGGGPEQILGSTDATRDLAFSPTRDQVAFLDASSGEIRVLSRARPQAPPLRVLRGPAFNGGHTFTGFDREGGHITQAGPNNSVHLWDLETFPDARPAVLGRPGQSQFRIGDFTPEARWIISSAARQGAIEFWPVGGPRRRELPRPAGSMAFTADGKWLAVCGAAPLRLLPVSAADGSARDLGQSEACFSLATHPEEDLVLEGTAGLVNGGRGTVRLHSLSGASRELLGRSPVSWGLQPLAFDSSGERALASQFDLGGLSDPAHRILRAWDLASGRERVYSIAHLTDADWWGFYSLSFAPDGSLYGAGKGGVRRLHLPEAPGETVTSEVVYAASVAGLDLSRDGQQLLVGASQTAALGQPVEELRLVDREQGTDRRITTHGTQLLASRLSPSGRAVITGSADGTVRIGPATGEEPHLLLGHEGPVIGLAVSPDERWVASASADAFYVWPMPDVTKPPLHTLPHDELLAKLDALTNLRVVRDASSPTGWSEEIGPFPGWKDVPTW